MFCSFVFGGSLPSIVSNKFPGEEMYTYLRYALHCGQYSIYLILRSVSSWFDCSEDELLWWLFLLSCCSNDIDIDGRNFPICLRPRLRALSIFSKRCCMFDRCDSRYRSKLS